MRLPKLKPVTLSPGASYCAHCVQVCHEGLALTKWSNGRRYWICAMCRLMRALHVTPIVEGVHGLSCAGRSRYPTMAEQEARLRGGGLRSTRFAWDQAAAEQRSRGVGPARGWASSRAS